MPFSLTRWAVLALSAACLSGTALAQSPPGWQEHRNEKYGFSLQYPGHLFSVERTSDAGDGQVFVSQGGEARLLVGALVNEARFVPATYQKHVARESYGNYTIGYRKLGRSWFVLSGEGDGKIFYEKVMFSCSGRLINSFAMIYPADRREVFDAVVERIEDTFRPGSACERAGVRPEVSQRPRAASRTRRPRVVRGPRSEMADRIARERGQDVIVILRRSTPPYDRRIVRGYVSR